MAVLSHRKSFLKIICYKICTFGLIKTDADLLFLTISDFKKNEKNI